MKSARSLAVFCFWMMVVIMATGSAIVVAACENRTANFFLYVFDDLGSFLVFSL
jgi:hypothetical protein